MGDNDERTLAEDPHFPPNKKGGRQEDPMMMILSAEPPLKKKGERAIQDIE